MGRITINPYEKGPKKSLKKDIKTQDKEIEITSNGTTEVTPDTGFTALNSVSVRTNVPQSGEGGGSNDVEYISFKDESYDEALSLITALSLSIRLELEDGGITARLVVPSYTYAKQYSQQKPSAIKFNRNEKMNMLIGMDESGNPIIQSLTAVEYLSLAGQAFIDKFNSLPRITEEEFYTIGNVEGNSVIEFTINGTSYQAEEGMTWGEWVNSDYNTGNFISNGSDILTEDSAYYVSDSITLGVFVNMEIEERQYILEPVDSGSSGGEEEGNGSFS